MPASPHAPALSSCLRLGLFVGKQRDVQIELEPPIAFVTGYLAQYVQLHKTSDKFVCSLTADADQFLDLFHAGDRVRKQILDYLQSVPGTPAQLIRDHVLYEQFRVGTMDCRRGRFRVRPGVWFI